MSQDHKRRDLLVDAFITGGIADLAHLLVCFDEELAGTVDLILVEEFEEGFVHDIAEEPGKVFFIHADLCGDVDPFVVGGVQLIGKALGTMHNRSGSCPNPIAVFHFSREGPASPSYWEG